MMNARSPCDWTSLDEMQREEILRRPAIRANDTIRQEVVRIIDKVREQGDKALINYSKLFDQAEPESLVVTDREIAAAQDSLSVAQVNAIDFAITNVKRFHEHQKPSDIDVETVSGVRCQRISRPIDSVGLYVPAGTAPLPSAAVMLAVPARIAACPQLFLCTPCRADGLADPAVVTAASRAGVTQIFKTGGAQAIAAMAYGTETIPRANKLFGPGNAWVTAAKSIVAADPSGPAIDMPAGPSEVLVIADAGASAEFVAADLLSQAEHGEDSQVILISNSEQLVANVIAAIDRQISSLSRRDIVEKSMRHCRLILVCDLRDAFRISNEYAPEHLILQIDNPRSAVSKIRNAGSVFLGPWAPESVGDYCSGTNHVLPTYGAANRYSGLSVDQFMRQMTVQELTEPGLQALAPAVVELAMLEGLDAHANAVRCRVDCGGRDR